MLRKKKPAQRRKKVMIADASRLFRRGRAQNYLEPEHALEIQGWFEKFEDVQDAVRIVGIDEIKAEDWTLNISRYVLPPLQDDIPPLPEAIAAFKNALTRCREAEDRPRRKIHAAIRPPRKRRRADHAQAAEVKQPRIPTEDAKFFDTNCTNQHEFKPRTTPNTRTQIQIR